MLQYCICIQNTQRVIEEHVYCRLLGLEYRSFSDEHMRVFPHMGHFLNFKKVNNSIYIVNFKPPDSQYEC